MTTTALRTVSYGGGVQSTALLVLAAQRRIDFPLFLRDAYRMGARKLHPDAGGDPEAFRRLGEAWATWLSVTRWSPSMAPRPGC